MIKLILIHLNDLTLIRNLSLGEFEGLPGHSVPGDNLRSILAIH